MATTFKAIREAMATAIEAMTPTYLPHFRFRQTDDRNAIESLPRDLSLVRTFEIDSLGVEGKPSTMDTSIVRDVKKRCVVKVAYPITDNAKEIRDMADYDEFQIIHYFELPDNIRAMGAWNCGLEQSSHSVVDNRRITEIEFLIHYQNAAP